MFSFKKKILNEFTILKKKDLSVRLDSAETVRLHLHFFFFLRIVFHVFICGYSAFSAKLRYFNGSCALFTESTNLFFQQNFR